MLDLARAAGVPEAFVRTAIDDARLHDIVVVRRTSE
jgi:hypothetical protein